MIEFVIESTVTAGTEAKMETTSTQKAESTVGVASMSKCPVGAASMSKCPVRVAATSKAEPATEVRTTKTKAVMKISTAKTTTAVETLTRAAYWS